MLRLRILVLLVLAATLGAGAWWALSRARKQTQGIFYGEDRLASALRGFGSIKNWIKHWYALPLDLKSLKVPPGFRIALFVRTESPRLMAFSPGGVLLVTSESRGTVTALPDVHGSGQATAKVAVLEDLNGPHGIAFHDGRLYVAEVTRLVRYSWDEARLQASNPVVISGLPESLGGHMTRTILFANQKLYVSAGSSCNVCNEKDRRLWK